MHMIVQGIFGMVFKVPNGDSLVLKIFSAGILVSKILARNVQKISKIHVTCADSLLVRK